MKKVTIDNSSLVHTSWNCKIFPITFAKNNNKTGRTVLMLVICYAFLTQISISFSPRLAKAKEGINFNFTGFTAHSSTGK